MKKNLPGHVGVSEVPVGCLALIEQFVFTTELGISFPLGNWLHAQVSTTLGVSELPVGFLEQFVLTTKSY